MQAGLGTDARKARVGESRMMERESWGKTREGPIGVRYLRTPLGQSGGRETEEDAIRSPRAGDCTLEEERNAGGNAVKETR